MGGETHNLFEIIAEIRDTLREIRDMLPEKRKRRDDTETTAETQAINAVLEYYGAKTGRKPDDAARIIKSRPARRAVRARLREKHTPDQCRAAIDSAYDQMWHNPELRRFVHPTTIFRPEKFPRYLDAACIPEQKSAYSTVED